MSNIPILHASVNRIWSRLKSGRFDRERYVRLARVDLSLYKTDFHVFAALSSLANFATKLIDFRRQRRYLRTERTKSTVNRRISRMVSMGKVHRLGGHMYRLRHDRRARPICLGLVNMATDPESAQAVQFLLWLAFWRGSLAAITIEDIRQGLSVGRREAACMASWLRANVDQVDRRTLRRMVFFSRRPSWWEHPHTRRAGAKRLRLTRDHFAPGTKGRLSRISQIGLTGSKHSPAPDGNPAANPAFDHRHRQPAQNGLDQAPNVGSDPRPRVSQPIGHIGATLQSITGSLRTGPGRGRTPHGRGCIGDSPPRRRRLTDKVILTKDQLAGMSASEIFDYYRRDNPAGYRGVG